MQNVVNKLSRGRPSDLSIKCLDKEYIHKLSCRIVAVLLTFFSIEKIQYIFLFRLNCCILCFGAPDDSHYRVTFWIYCDIITFRNFNPICFDEEP